MHSAVHKMIPSFSLENNSTRACKESEADYSTKKTKS